MTIQGAFVNNTGTQSINHATTTALIFQHVVRDDASFWSSGANTRLTAPNDGWYAIGFALIWDTNGANSRIAELRLNGVTSFPISAVNSLSFSVPTRQSGYLQYYLTAGDFFEVTVWQNTFVARTVNTPSYFYMMELT
jgi:hypothetical protein